MLGEQHHAAPPGDVAEPRDRLDELPAFLCQEAAAVLPGVPDGETLVERLEIVGRQAQDAVRRGPSRRSQMARVRRDRSQRSGTIG